MFCLMRKRKSFTKKNNGFVNEMIHWVEKWHLRFHKCDFFPFLRVSYFIVSCSGVSQRATLGEVQKFISSPGRMLVIVRGCWGRRSVHQSSKSYKDHAFGSVGEGTGGRRGWENFLDHLLKIHVHYPATGPQIKVIWGKLSPECPAVKICSFFLPVDIYQA